MPLHIHNVMLLFHLSSISIVTIQHSATELEKAPLLPTHPLLLNDIVGFPMDTVEFGYGIFKF